MPTIWIRNTIFSLKKVSLLCFISILTALALVYTNKLYVLFFQLGIFTSLTTCLAFLAYKNGLYILKKRTTHQKKYQVRDFLSLRNPRENYREIVSENNDAIVLSRIFLNQKKPWSFFDLFRIILIKQKKIKNVLLLGGGGGVVAKTISEQFPAVKITVIEISKEMIAIADTFFLEKNKKIHLIQQDAFAFVKKNTEPFDIVIIDLFDGPTICPKVKTNAFISRIFDCGKVILINFGFEYETMAKYTSAYTKEAQKRNQPFHLYLSGKNIFGCNIDTSKLDLGALRIDNL